MAGKKTVLKEEAGDIIGNGFVFIEQRPSNSHRNLRVYLQCPKCAKYFETDYSRVINFKTKSNINLSLYNLN